MARIKNLSSSKITLDDMPGAQSGSGTTMYPNQELVVFNEDLNKSLKAGALITEGILSILSAEEPVGSPEIPGEPAEFDARLTALEDKVGEADPNMPEGIVKLDVSGRFPAGDGSLILGILRSIRAGISPALNGAVRLLAGTNIVLSQVGQDITIESTGSGGPPSGAAGGDLDGTYPDPDVVAIQGIPVSATDPTLGQVLKFDGTEWKPDTDSGTQPDASATVKGVTKLSTAPAVPTDPIAVGTNDPRIPTQDENDALVGTSGTPSASNEYVTDADPRNTDSRTPNGAAAGDLEGTYPAPTVKRATNLVQGKVRLATAPASASDPVAAGDNDPRLADSRTPSGGAGGDLGGTYPSPSVLKVNGVAVTGVPTVGQVPTATSPTTATWQDQSGGGGGNPFAGLGSPFLARAFPSRDGIAGGQGNYIHVFTDGTYFYAFESYQNPGTMLKIHIADQTTQSFAMPWTGQSSNDFPTASLEYGGFFYLATGGGGATAKCFKVNTAGTVVETYDAGSNTQFFGITTDGTSIFLAELEVNPAIHRVDLDLANPTVGPFIQPSVQLVQQLAYAGGKLWGSSPSEGYPAIVEIDPVTLAVDAVHDLTTYNPAAQGGDRTGEMRFWDGKVYVVSTDGGSSNYSIYRFDAASISTTTERFKTKTSSLFSYFQYDGNDFWLRESNSFNFNRITFEAGEIINVGATMFGGDGYLSNTGSSFNIPGGGSWLPMWGIAFTADRLYAMGQSEVYEIIKDLGAGAPPPPATSAGGDLSGTYPNPTVAKVNGVAVSGTPAVGKILRATGAATAEWKADPYTGTGAFIATNDWRLNAANGDPRNAESMSYDGTNFWMVVLPSGDLYKVSTAGVILSRITPPAPLRTAVFQGGFVWAIGDDVLYKIDTTTELSVASYSNGKQFRHLSGNGTYLFINDGGNSGARVFRFDPATGLFFGQFEATPPNAPDAIATDDSTTLWTVDRTSSTIQRIDRDTAAVLGTIDVSASGLPQCAIYVSAFVWVTMDNGDLLKVNPATDVVDATFPSGATALSSVTTDGQFLMVGEAAPGSKIRWFDISDEYFVDDQAAGNIPDDVVTDTGTTNIWSIDRSSATIRRLNRKTGALLGSPSTAGFGTPRRGVFSAGFLWVVTSTGDLLKINPTTDAVDANYASGDPSLSSIAGGDDTYLYVGYPAGQNIRRFDIGGAAFDTNLTGLGFAPDDISWDVGAGRIYLLDNTDPTEIYQFDTAGAMTGSVTLAADGGNARRIANAVENPGTAILLVTMSSGNIVGFDVNSLPGAIYVTIPSGYATITGIYKASGSDFFLSAVASDNKFTRLWYDALNFKNLLRPVTIANQPDATTVVNNDVTHFWAATFGDPIVRRINLATGGISASLDLTAYGNPRGLVVGGSSLIITLDSGKLIRADTTGPSVEQVRESGHTALGGISQSISSWGLAVGVTSPSDRYLRLTDFSAVGGFYVEGTVFTGVPSGMTANATDLFVCERNGGGNDPQRITISTMVISAPITGAGTGTFAAVLSGGFAYLGAEDASGSKIYQVDLGTNVATAIRTSIQQVGTLEVVRGLYADASDLWVLTGDDFVSYGPGMLERYSPSGIRSSSFYYPRIGFFPSEYGVPMARVGNVLYVAMNNSLHRFAVELG